MRATLSMTALFALSVATAWAGDEVMAPRFGNTIVITSASGSTSRISYSADHTFKATNGFITIGGTWSLEGRNLCRKYSFTIPGHPTPECDPVALHKVGETWADGENSYTMVKGVQ